MKESQQNVETSCEDILAVLPSAVGKIPIAHSLRMISDLQDCCSQGPAVWLTAEEAAINASIHMSAVLSPAAPLLSQCSAVVLQKAEEDGSSDDSPATHGGDLRKTQASAFSLSQLQSLVKWDTEQQINTCLAHSATLPVNFFFKKTVIFFNSLT